jgi:CRISPR-associated protein Cmr3
MKTWIVEPRDTLVIRDGRPVLEGAPEMRSLDFPWPSTIAGFVRTRIGTDERARFMLTPDAAREIPVLGPWLVKLDEAGRIAEHLVPAPQDCVWHEVEPKADPPRWERRRLAPIALPAGCATDLATGHELVGHEGELPEGKAGSGPRFWRWSELERWLLAPARVSSFGSELGHEAPVRERRVHVSVERERQTAADGMLFSTDGLRFTTRSRERLALAFGCEDARLGAGPAFVGGERRLSFLRPGQGTSMPALPVDLELDAGRLARVVLLTPAIFREGSTPGSFGEGTTVIASVVTRAEIISGWDFALDKDGKQRGPKQTRRMAPAGSTYWVRLDKDVDARRWAEGVWMKCVSDDEQDRRDGFGLAVVGVG